MTRTEAIDTAFDLGNVEGDFNVIVHRAYPGEHDYDSTTCWCNPMVFDGDDPRTPEEVLADIETLEAEEAVH